MIDRFGNIAKQLAVNPLGIIALFIVLVYGIAAMVLGVAGTTLETGERIPIIWFLALFPVVVLFTFAWLVANHHTKLYAPKDFQDSQTFLQTLDPEVQIRRLNEDVRALREDLPSQHADEVREEPTNLTYRREQNLRRNVVLIEDLVMRELGSEFGVNINRQVGIGKDVGFDGMFVKAGEAFIIEVKFLARPSSQRRLANSVRLLANNIAGFGWRRVNLILCVVLNAEATQHEGQIKKSIQEELADLPFAFDLKIYSAQQLLAKYGLDNEQPA